MPTTTSAMPIGVIEKMPSGLPPLRSIRSLASRKAGALTSVSVVPSDAASDIGISRRDAGMFCSCAWRRVIGSIIAVTITWWVNEASAATAGISTATARASLRPAARPIHRPRRSVMPVAARPPEMTNTAATMIAGSLANPDSAWSASSTPAHHQRQQHHHRGDIHAQAFADEQIQRTRQNQEEQDLLQIHRVRLGHGSQFALCGMAISRDVYPHRLGAWVQAAACPRFGP